MDNSQPTWKFRIVGLLAASPAILGFLLLPLISRGMDRYIFSTNRFRNEEFPSLSVPTLLPLTGPVIVTGEFIDNLWFVWIPAVVAFYLFWISKSQGRIFWFNAVLAALFVAGFCLFIMQSDEQWLAMLKFIRAARRSAPQIH